MATIIVLSIVCFVFAVLCLALVLYTYMVNRMLVSKDLIIMGLMRRIELDKELNPPE